MEIIKEKINTTNYIGALHINKTFTKTVKIPDIMPDYKTAPRYKAYADLTSAETAEGILLYKGVIRLFFICSPSSEYIKVSLPLEDSFPIDFSEERDYKTESAVITGGSVSYTPEGDLSCSLNLILNFIVIQTGEYDVITDIKSEDGLQTEKTVFTQNTADGFSRETFKLKNEFNLTDIIETDEIDEIDSIYESCITLKNIAVKNNDEGLTVEGNALINITYSPKSKNNSVNFKKKVPFTKNFALKNAAGVKFCSANLSVTDDTVTSKQDENGKNLVIDYEIEILCSWFSIREEKISCISEVHKLNKKIDRHYTRVPYLSAVCRNSSEFTVSEPLILDSADPAVFQIYRISCTAVTDSVTAYQGKIVTEGFLTADILYAAKDDETPVYSADAVFPYKRSIELPGVTSESDICLYTTTAVKYSDSKISDETNISADAKISLTAYAFKINSVPLISGLDIADLTAEELAALPSMVLYTVKPGDSLLKIAEKYNASVADIIEINKPEAPDNLTSGEKILLVKNVM